ncbi:MAG TPA: hypothetical protein VM756_09955 [Burkholderiales bacterium]|nr:hypothetical protein [Burkholderiales bacterium]
MDQWDERMTRHPDRIPTLELLETCWQFTAPSKRILSCAVYQTDIGLEVRVGYSEDDLLFSVRMPDLETARKKAAELRAAVVAKGGFTELP